MTSVQPYPVVSNLIERFGDWIQQRRQLNELSQLDSSEFRRMAHELGLAPNDLDTIVRKGVNGAEELPQMLRALGFDEAAIARIQPPHMMEMRHACAGCATSALVASIWRPRRQRPITRTIAPMPMTSRCWRGLRSRLFSTSARIARKAGQVSLIG